MGLLFESKRMWLLSYVICTLIPGALYYWLWDYPIAKTIGIMFIELQIIMFVFFLLILIFKWKVYCRAIASLVYLGITIYEGVMGNLIKWYIIIPVFLVTEVYMIWNLGGVVNCAIASPYRSRLNAKINVGQDSYGSYAGDLDEYNQRNSLGFFSKVRKNREPNWEKLRFNYTALEMFYFENAFIGIDSSQLDNKENKLDKINSKLSNKIDVLDSNRSLFEEKNTIDKISLKAKTAGLDTSGYDESREKLEAVRKKNVKTGNSILKKRL